ncbi:hypothetical protein Dimus_015336 [Dionaea muscipula]
MAGLQRSPVAFQSRLAQPPQPASKSLSSRPLFLTGSSAVRFNPLRLSTLTANLLIKSRGGGGGALGATMADTAAGNYATALAEVAQSNGTFEATTADIGKIEKIFSDQQVYDFFVNPVLDVENKLAVIDEIAKSSSLQPHTANFLKILIDSDRIDLIIDIVKEFEQFCDDFSRTEVAVVSSVVPLENQQLAQIAKEIQQLTGAKNVRVKTEVDSSLLAGLTIRYGKTGSNLIDMSAKKQLNDIAANLDTGDFQFAI